MDFKKVSFFKVFAPNCPTIETSDLNQNNLQTSDLEENINLKIFGLSIRGPSHITSDIPCQDACNYKILDKNKGIIAIADGLGSAPFSDIGAKFCVKSAIDLIQKMYVESYLDDINIEEIVFQVIEETRTNLVDYSLINKYNLQDLACTLIIVLIDGNNCAVSQIGDGAVVSSYGDDIFLISEPNNLEYRNEVIPITSDQWKEFVIVRKTSNFNNIAVFTDGVQDALMQKIDGKWVVNSNGFKYLFSWAKSQTNEEESIAEMERVLNNKFALVSSDDKTLVILVKE
ncbi:PP2C family serine/threonine-protein phosphatase [Methanospirillum lacunae]|uniref:PPM-type phosphatase domain-containing protein n=1 Tax=Methanospirillum lacunae TaxID=668570 RepID=A0A2V2NBY1_9EURY|nr:PP2C family serine/threonine-protein phosphatase [Methanospirillum lacunae]PWR73857.1 hypothetical protein DK846_01425 [Methanospirillum lacunae]